MVEQISTQSQDWPDGQGDLRRPPVADDDALIVDVDGFEGPLDLLLDLARTHKIDLSRISILALADQYIAFIDKARTMRLELAADYLVMAAWLTYLKSRLLIPQPPKPGEAEPQDMAQRLAFRLQRLQAMREAADKLMQKAQLNRDVFARGAPEPLCVETQTQFADTLMDLLKAYAQRRQRKLAHQSYTVKKQAVWSIRDARAMLERMIGSMDEWGPMEMFLSSYLSTPDTRRSMRASSFTASLELAREGVIEIRQESAFSPIFMRRRVNAA